MNGNIVKIILILCISAIQIAVYAQQQNITKNTLLATGESLANQMAKTYQAARNCDQELASIAAPRAAALFQNYFEKHEVAEILEQYKTSVAEEKGKSCNYGAIKTHLLMQKIADYMRMAAPFAH